MSVAVYHFIYCFLYPIVHLLYPYRFHHRERIPETGPMMICASHSNLVDPLLLAYLLGWKRPIRFMAKKELMETPLLGAILRKAGTFGVDRGHADMGAIRSSMAILKDKGDLGIFPEGTRLQESGDGKHGAIMLAARSGAKVVPVYIPRKKRLFRRLDIVVGEAYMVDKSLHGRDAYEEQAGKLMERIEALKDELEA